jgi:hypothetical protein
MKTLKVPAGTSAEGTMVMVRAAEFPKAEVATEPLTVTFAMAPLKTAVSTGKVITIWLVAPTKYPLAASVVRLMVYCA